MISGILGQFGISANTYPQAVLLNGRDPQGRGQVRLARSRATDQHHVLCGLGKLKRGQLFDQRLIDFRLTKVEVCQATVNRETYRVHLIADGANRAICCFRVDQVFDQPFGNLQRRAAALFD